MLDVTSISIGITILTYSFGTLILGLILLTIYKITKLIVDYKRDKNHVYNGEWEKMN